MPRRASPTRALVGCTACCATLVLLLALGDHRAGADSPKPYPGHLGSSADGRWYVVVRPANPCTFLLVKRREGAAARARFPPAGRQPWRSPLGPPGIEEGDKFVARGTCAGAPQQVVCLDQGEGFLLFDEWWGSGRGVVLARHGSDGEPMWTRRLADLFDERTRASFRRSVSHTVWQHGWWVDAARRRVVVVGANQEPRILGLDDGEPLTFDVEDVLGRLDRGAESERTLVLDLVVRHEAAWAQKILAHVGERELAPAARLRIQIAMAKAGDEEARREILARRRSEPDPALRMDILRYLPDAIGPTAAMGILIEELGSTESWAGARDGLVALGAEAIPELTRLLADRSDPTRRHGAVAILRDIGPPAASAVPMLRDVAAEGGPLSETVAMALSRIDTPAALEAMVTVLGAGSREARRHAAAYFQGRPASAAIPGLVALLEVEGDESWQNVIRDGLVRASGEDFGLDAPAWRRWWAERDAR